MEENTFKIPISNVPIDGSNVSGDGIARLV